VRDDEVFVDRERYAIEEFAAGRAENTFPGFRFIRGAVGGAQDVATIFGQELIVNPVHGHWHVTAAVDIRAEVPAVVQQETLNLPPIHLQDKFFRLSWRKLANTGDDDLFVLEH